MDTKLLYVVGNLYTGYPYGVEAGRQFGTTELHGPFSGENEANTYAHKLIEDGAPTPESGPYEFVKVVKIETPQAGVRIVLKEDGTYAYPTV
jgi:hypothetical protein